MTFAAHTIKDNASSGYNVGLVGVLLFLLAIICFIIPALKGYGIYVAIIGILLVLFGAISGSGSGMVEVGDEMLECNETGLLIGGKSYLFDSIDSLHFHFDSFYSQSSAGYYYENAGMIRYGMGNQLSFVADGQHVSVRFFLGNIIHSDLFFTYLRELEAAGVRFRFSRSD